MEKRVSNTKTKYYTFVLSIVAGVLVSIITFHYEGWWNSNYKYSISIKDYKSCESKEGIKLIFHLPKNESVDYNLNSKAKSVVFDEKLIDNQFSIEPKDTSNIELFNYELSGSTININLKCKDKSSSQINITQPQIIDPDTKTPEEKTGEVLISTVDSDSKQHIDKNVITQGIINLNYMPELNFEAITVQFKGVETKVDSFGEFSIATKPFDDLQQINILYENVIIYSGQHLPGENFQPKLEGFNFSSLIK